MPFVVLLLLVLRHGPSMMMLLLLLLLYVLRLRLLGLRLLAPVLNWTAIQQAAAPRQYPKSAPCSEGLPYHAVVGSAPQSPELLPIAFR